MKKTFRLLLTYLKNYWPLVTYMAAIVLIIWPFFSSGHVFTIDQVFQEQISKPIAGENIYLWRLLQYVWQQALPSWLFEKLIFIAFFLILALGSDRWLSLFKVKTPWKVFGVLALIFSPLVYDRFTDGSTNVYLSYAIYPWLMYYFWRFLETPNFKRLWSALIFSWLLIGTSIYNIAIVFLLLALMSITAFFNSTVVSRLKLAKMVSILTLLIVISNLYWIIPTARQDNPQGYLVFSSIAKEDYDFYKPDDIGPIDVHLTVAFGTGYWGASMNRYDDLFSFGSWFWVASCSLLLALSLYGLLSGLLNSSKQRNLFRFLAVLAVISYFLSLGLSSPISRGFTLWLFENFKAYNGFRETTKWQGILMLSLAPGLVFGAYNIFLILRKRLLKIVFIVILSLSLLVNIIPLTSASHMQLEPKPYPQGWYKAKAFVNSYLANYEKTDSCPAKDQGLSNACYQLLIFPWHKYQRYRFLDDGKSYNILEGYFNNQALSGDNVEIGNIYSQSSRLESKIVEKYVGWRGYWQITRETHAQELVADLESLGIKAIILAKELSYEGYEQALDLIVKQDNRILIGLDNKDIKIYLMR